MNAIFIIFYVYSIHKTSEIIFNSSHYTFHKVSHLDKLHKVRAQWMVIKKFPNKNLELYCFLGSARPA